jgi:thioredoxin 1
MAETFSQEGTMSEFVSEVNDQSFESDVLASKTPVLVDFWAEWCGPCRMLAPTVEKVAQEYQGQVKVVKMNIEESVNVPNRLGIKSIPTLIVFKNGSEQDRLIGNQPKEAISQMIARHV